MLSTFRKKRKSNTRRNLLIGAGVGAVGITGTGYLLTRGSRSKRPNSQTTAIVHVPGQGYTHGASAPMLEYHPKLQTRKGRPNKNWDKYNRSNPGAYSKVNVNRSNLFYSPAINTISFDRGDYSVVYSDDADFAFNPFGLVARAAAIAPTIKKSARTYRSLGAKKVGKINQIRGAAQIAAQTYLDGTKSASVTSAATNAAYRGGRSALRSLKNTKKTGAGAVSRVASAGKALVGRGAKEVASSATGVVKSTLAAPISAVGDATTLHNVLRPKGKKLPGSGSKIGRGLSALANSQVGRGVQRAGKLVGVFEQGTELSTFSPMYLVNYPLHDIYPD